jgi:all-trans-retinol dehydrogenase (NAD+)
MIRCIILIAASIALHTTDPTILNLGNSLTISDTQAVTVLQSLKWSFTLWAIHEFNTVLNRWAENKWQWKDDTSDWNWESEIAVVTGGSQGIGACVVKRLVSFGVRCAVLDVAPLSENFTKGWYLTRFSWSIAQHSNMLVDELRLVEYYRCDVTSHDAIQNAAQAIRSDFGSPSILINNAGIGNAFTILDVLKRVSGSYSISISSVTSVQFRHSCQIC